MIYQIQQLLEGLRTLTGILEFRYAFAVSIGLAKVVCVSFLFRNQFCAMSDTFVVGKHSLNLKYGTSSNISENRKSTEIDL